ncbi:MAG: sodium ion-translocating decarboxylase subunit beta [Verrucomicrobiaceae bacterium]|nr:sodium ion-translocating decarboxylase subunit beta [Verrucomicrobiaceae bacterium]
MLNSLIELAYESGFCYVDWRMIVMWCVVAVLMYLAVFRQYEPLLLVPIAFGALLANLPTEGVLNKPAGYLISPVEGVVKVVTVKEGDTAFAPRMIKQLPTKLSDIAKSKETATEDIKAFFKMVEDVTSKEGRKDVFKKAKGIPDLIAIVSPTQYEPKKKIEKELKGSKFLITFNGKPLELNAEDHFVWTQATGNVATTLISEGQKVDTGEKLVDVYSARTGGLYHYIQFGVLLELFPPLIFLGVGALTDFGPLIANPKMLLLGGAAQFGVFATFMGALCLGFTSPEAASIGIIGGADGPTSIFISNKLAPHLLAPIAVAAYSYMALVPIIQPPIMRFFTTEAERKIKMKSLRKVSRLEKLIFALVVTIACILLVPDVSALIGMLMLGNFLKESGVCERLSKAAQNELINVVTIFLGTSVGITMTGDRFIRAETLYILALGVVAFSFSTAAGIWMAKTMNLFLKEKINPLIGSAGVSAVPMAARVSQVEGAKADPSNFLLMHAMGPNVAGVIGTALVAGFFIATLAH